MKYLILAFALFLSGSQAFGQVNVDSLNQVADSLHRLSEATDLPTTQKKYQPKWKYRPDSKRFFHHSDLNASFLISARFERNAYLLDFSPNLAYRPNDQLEIGTGFVYQYIDLTDRPLLAPRTNGYGVRAYTRVYPWTYFYLHFEYLYVNAEFSVFSARGNFHNFVFGGGFNISIGDQLYIITQITSNMLEDALYNQRRPFATLGLGVRL